MCLSRVQYPLWSYPSWLGPVHFCMRTLSDIYVWENLVAPTQNTVFLFPECKVSPKRFSAFKKQRPTKTLQKAAQKTTVHTMFELLHKAMTCLIADTLKDTYIWSLSFSCIAYIHLDGTGKLTNHRIGFYGKIFCSANTLRFSQQAGRSLKSVCPRIAGTGTTTISWSKSRFGMPTMGVIHGHGSLLSTRPRLRPSRASPWGSPARSPRPTHGRWYEWRPSGPWSQSDMTGLGGSWKDLWFLDVSGCFWMFLDVSG